jgi:protein-tyrosine phosphatase
MIASTPHLRPDFPDVHVGELARRCLQLREAIEQEGMSLDVASGAELSLGWALDASDEQLLLASYGQRGSDLLVETPFTQLVGLDRFLYELRAKGYRITLAHPERNANFQRDDQPLQALAEQGVLFQLNADSLIGSGEGRGARRLARKLLREGLATAIASDGHRATSWRPVTRLAQAIEAVAELVGEERALWLARDAPAAVVSGGELPQAPPISNQRSRRRLFGLR